LSGTQRISPPVFAPVEAGVIGGTVDPDPALQPNREFLEERYGMFRRAG
jgi:hypothetical protein